MKRALLPLSFCLATTAHAATFHVAPLPLSSVANELQFRTISEAAKAVKAGDRVLIHSGLYREGVSIETSGTAALPIRFEAAPNANVVVSGADVMTNWRKEENTGGDNVFSTPWDHNFIPWNKTMTHPDDDYHLIIGRGEQVIAGGYALQQVLSRDKLARGTFFADFESKRLYVQTANNAKDLNGTRIEAATRARVWEVKGAWVQTRGLQFRYASDAAQQGMTRVAGAHATVSECVFERANSLGAAFDAPDIEARNCTFRDNGQLGWRTDRAHRLHFVGCLTQNNNVKNFDRGFEAGGNKITFSRDVVIENSRFLNNRGIGIWFDIGNENAQVRNCLIADNEDAGMAYEISFGLHAHDNIFAGNGLAGTGMWGFDGGLAVSSSPGCVVERNLFIGNKEGFQFRDFSRTTPLIDQVAGAKDSWVWDSNETIQNNTFALNRDAAVWGWFDVYDERHWPKSLQKFGGREKADYQINNDDMMKQVEADQKNGGPTGLSLEKMNIQFQNNLYDLSETGGGFRWGAAWRRHEYFDNSDAMQKVQAMLGLEKGSVVAPFQFNDYVTRDFRVPANSLALKMKSYPVGPIPGALTGVLPTTKVVPVKLGK